MENKTIIHCPKCDGRVRIPNDKHIKFTCVHCKSDYFADHGLIVRFPSIKKQNQKSIESDYKELKKLNAKYRKISKYMSAINIMLVVFILVYIVIKQLPQEKHIESVDYIVNNFVKTLNNLQLEASRNYLTEETKQLFKIIVEPIFVYGNDEAKAEINEIFKSVSVGEITSRKLNYSGLDGSASSIEIRFIRSKNDKILIDIDKKNVF